MRWLCDPVWAPVTQSNTRPHEERLSLDRLKHIWKRDEIGAFPLFFKYDKSTNFTLGRQLKGHHRKSQPWFCSLGPWHFTCFSPLTVKHREIMTKVTQGWGGCPTKAFCWVEFHSDTHKHMHTSSKKKKIIKDHLLYDQPAHSFFLFFLFCFEMSVLWGAILILFHSV